MSKRKWCPKCEKQKALSEFHKSRRARDGLQGYCIDCNTKQAQLAEWRKAGMLMTHDEYDRMYREQNGKCAVCDTTPGAGQKRLHVDHRHGSDKVRALLCFDCNTALGRFKDSPEILRRAAAYLDSHSAAR